MKESQILIPRNIDTISKIALGDNIVYTMGNSNHIPTSYTGLERNYALSGYPSPIYIFDNHNYALYFRTQWLRDTGHIPGTIIHIDQHSDIRENRNIFDITKIHDNIYLEEFATNLCTVGNFIPPLLNAGVLTHCEQVRTQRKLLNYEAELSLQPIPQTYILDIDLDFRAPEMSISAYHKTLEKTRQLLRKASLVTIATSPGFIDQQLALNVLKDIFEHLK